MNRLILLIKFIRYYYKSLFLGDKYEYVYVRQDGSVRELCQKEKEYLEADHIGGDGEMPYIKDNYKSKNGWGSIRGFCLRIDIPSKIPIVPWEDRFAVEEEKENILDYKKMGIGTRNEH